jgi:DNA-binding transcriptional LysR family regulator
MKTIDSIDLRTLRVFDAVATSMSFSVAGRQLDLSRALTSRLVANLEDQLEVKLFRRTTRKVMLTEQGSSLAQAIRGHLLGLRESLQAAQRQTTSIAGVVRISVSHAFGRVVLLPKIALFKARYPDIEVQVFLADGIDDLLDEQLDLTIRLGPLPNSNLVARSLGRLTVALMGASSLLAGKKPPRATADLGSWPSIGFRVPGSGQAYQWVFVKAGQSTSWSPTQPSLVVNSIEAVADAVISGQGIAPVPKFLLVQAIARGEVKLLMTNFELPSIPVHICFTDKALMPARTRLLIDFLVQELPEQLI